MAGKVVTFHPGPLRGSAYVPGDKSISHRALIAGAYCREPLRVAHLNPGRDVRATREALNALGTQIRTDESDAIVSGSPLRSPAATIDCMNSGSTVRMLLGACAGTGVRARFDGDASLRRRPMEPVAAQLRAFGARIETAEGHLPLELRGRSAVETRDFILLSPSAQVKSALLFAGLFAGVPVSITGDRGSRDHTERLLGYLGADIEWTERSVRLTRGSLVSRPVEIAGDFSAAAFFITAAATTPGSALVVRDVGVNLTRIGLLDALRAMGAAIELRNPRSRCGEPLADVEVKYRPLSATALGADLALRAIDEIPLVAIAAAFASGTTTIAGIAELRTKESDRIAAIERLLTAVGSETSYERGVLRIVGGTPQSRHSIVETSHDHRTAMAAAVLGCAAGPIAIDSDESLDVSFPGFLASLEALRSA
ncbi:MAG: 3-phosphoshikimate 1-carboxyvinyltransferase [Candidatus Cybelea sp.]